MLVLPEKIRRTLERIVADMRVKEEVYGVGLFGSWSRGEASPSNDVDLIVLVRVTLVMSIWRELRLQAYS